MTRRDIPFWNLPAQFREEADDILAATRAVLESGEFIGGRPIAELEAMLAERLDVAETVALNSGTDALVLGMHALGIGPGDEVITPPNSFVASTAAIVRIGAVPVFADVLDDQNIDPEQIERRITRRTKAIMAVHMTGRIAPMNEISDIAKRHGLLVIEDAAQSCGSTYHGRPSGGFGDIGCFSAHPLKNMNAAGDAGYLTTNRPELAARVRRLRNHGLVDRNTVEEFGFNSRMDTLQAAILQIRLRGLDEVIARKRALVALYRERLDAERVFIPACRPHEFNTFVLFVVQTDHRDALQAHLADHGIGSGIYYPVPIHLQPASRPFGHRRGDFPVAERQAERILALPINPYLGAEDVAHVADTVNAFVRAKA